MDDTIEIEEIAENFDPPRVVYRKNHRIPRALAPVDSIRKNVAIILITFRGVSSQPPTKAMVEDAFSKGVKNTVAFYESLSYGATYITGSVFGPFEVEKGTVSCDKWNWHSQATTKLRESGVDTSQFTNFMVIGPRLDECSFAGVAYVGGTRIYQNGNSSWGTFSHELGHNFGLNHAMSNNNGTISEYGDPWDRMGGGTQSLEFNAQFRDVIHIFDPEDIAEVTATSTIRLYPVDMKQAGPKLIRIARPDGGKLLIETRRGGTTYSPDTTAGAGKLLIRTTVGTAANKTTLHKVHPEINSPSAWGIPVGEVWEDPLSKVRIGLVDSTTTYSTVRVVIPNTEDQDKMIVFIAQGQNFPDALAAGPTAARLAGRLLLTQPTLLPPATKDALTALKPSEIIIVGGTAAVSAEVETQLKAYAPVVRRVAGQTRYDTAALIAQFVL